MKRRDMLLIHATQTRCVPSGPPDTTNTEQVVQEVLAQLGQDPQWNRGGRCRKPTPRPKRV